MIDPEREAKALLGLLAGGIACGCEKPNIKQVTALFARLKTVGEAFGELARRECERECTWAFDGSICYKHTPECQERQSLYEGKS